MAQVLYDITLNILEHSTIPEDHQEAYEQEIIIVMLTVLRKFVRNKGIIVLEEDYDPFARFRRHDNRNDSSSAPIEEKLEEEN